MFAFLFIAAMIFLILNAIFLALLSLDENSDIAAWVVLIAVVWFMVKACT